MAVQYFDKHHQLPSWQRYLELEPEADIVAPTGRDTELLPKWWPAFMESYTAYRARTMGTAAWVS